MSRKENLLTVYGIRHLPSEQNVAERGPGDTKLAEGNEEYKSKLIALVEALSEKGIDLVIAGNLIRHKQTTEGVLKESGYVGEVIEDTRLNAFMSGPLQENKAEDTEIQYGLHKFKPNQGSIYQGSEISFDPAEMGIFPFVPLYSFAYFSRDLRKRVFPDVANLPDFDMIKHSTEEFQAGLVTLLKSHLAQSSEPMRVLAISSCSAAAYNLEYSLFGTIGVNIIEKGANGVYHPARYGTENRALFPQQHDEVNIFCYTSEDLSRDSRRLSVIDGNVKIDALVKRLHDE
jgi:hypothetical protein